MEPLSVTLLLSDLIPVVILQGLDNVILRLLGGEVFGDERFQPFRLEADFLFLVGFLLTHDGEDHIGVEPAVLGKFFLCQVGTKKIFENLQAVHRRTTTRERLACELNS